MSRFVETDYSLRTVIFWQKISLNVSYDFALARCLASPVVS
jgi:hypothetical protein